MSPPGKEEFIFGTSQNVGLLRGGQIYNLCGSGVDSSLMLVGLRGHGGGKMSSAAPPAA